MDSSQLLLYVIRPALQALGAKYASHAAEQLLLATAAQETHCGHYIHQVNGPALGIYQMEASTLHDLYANYLAYHAEIPPRIGIEAPARLIYDARYATQCARLEYYREPTRLPDACDAHGMWRYYKRYWNSRLGAAGPAQFLANWAKYVRPASKAGASA